MAAAIAATAATNLGASPSFTAKRGGGGGGGGRVLVLAPLSIRAPPLHRRRRRAVAVCVIVEKETAGGGSFRNDNDDDDDEGGGGGGREATSNRSSIEDSEAERRIAERVARKRSERRTYLMAAVMSSLGITSMAVAAVYYRFAWQMEVSLSLPPPPLPCFVFFFFFGYRVRFEKFLNTRRLYSVFSVARNQGGEVPLTEMFGTFALSVGAAVRITNYSLDLNYYYY